MIGKHSYIVFILCLTACYPVRHFEKQIIDPVNQQPAISAKQKEIDRIYSLLVYYLVYRDWQPDTLPRNKRRGYNIGALLVDKNDRPVYYGLNCINSLDNATQHGEVRAITAYIAKEKCFNLDGFTIYTTLEPCIMCAGMMTMTAVKRVVYGQHDVEYSKAFERLAVDTRPIGGFPPYPRQVIAEASASLFTERLDSAYREFLLTDPEKILAKFLHSETARAIYHDAWQALLEYKLTDPSNFPIYKGAIQFLVASGNSNE